MGLADDAQALADALRAEIEQTSTRAQYIRVVNLAQQAERLAARLAPDADTV